VVMDGMEVLGARLRRRKREFASRRCRLVVVPLSFICASKYLALIALPRMPASAVQEGETTILLQGCEASSGKECMIEKRVCFRVVEALLPTS